MRTIDRIRGQSPKVEPAAISGQKPEVLQGKVPTTPPAPCPTCDGVIYWQSPGDQSAGGVTCWECMPPPRPAMVRGVWTLIVDNSTRRWEPVDWEYDRRSQAVTLRPAVVKATARTVADVTTHRKDQPAGRPQTTRAPHGPPDARGREVGSFPVEYVDDATWAERWAKMGERSAVLEAANDRAYGPAGGLGGPVGGQSAAAGGSAGSQGQSPAGVMGGAGGDRAATSVASAVPQKKNPADADVSPKFSPPKNAQDVAVLYRRGKSTGGEKSKTKDADDDRDLAVAMYDPRAKLPADGDVSAYTWAGAEKWVRVAGK